MSENVRDWALAKRGTRVGSGECFDLADQALRAGNYRSAADYGTVVPDADYVWGTRESNSANWRPGYIVQFRNYVQTLERDNPRETTTTTQERSHHTAVIQSVNADGSVTVLEQNAPTGSAVISTTLFLSNSSATDGDTSVTATVTGTALIYAPQAR
jgi:hypothetical protein